MDKKYIYFYYNDNHDMPLYIGQTVNVVRRFKQHTYEDRRFLLVDKICFFALPESYKKEDVDIVEAIFIQQMKPKFNRTSGHFFKLTPDTLNTIYTVLYHVLVASDGWEDFVKNYCEELRIENGVIKWEMQLNG